MIKTWPTLEVLENKAQAAPKFMRPSLTPYAAFVEGFISDADCSAIIRASYEVGGHEFPKCGAITREMAFDPSLDPVEATARGLNELYFGYDLDDGQHSFIQTYDKGGSYPMHMDGSPGQTRKLTAVVMLSEPSQYEGGLLSLHVTPVKFLVPKTRGTLVIFPSWIYHDVSEVTSGIRQTVNMGFWGPPFK